MDREPPLVTGAAPRSGGPPPDLLESAPSRALLLRWNAVLVLTALAVLAAVVVSAVDGTAPPAARPTPDRPSARPAPSWTDAPAGITATASVAGAPTDGAYEQRLTLTVELPAPAGRRGSGGRPPGDSVALLAVDVRGFAVRPVGARSPLPLGRFGRSTSTRSTTVPLQAAVVDCSIETLARRDIVLTVRAGGGPDGLVRVASDPDVVRALDRLVSRTCRRPRG